MFPNEIVLNSKFQKTEFNPYTYYKENNFYEALEM